MRIPVLIILPHQEPLRESAMALQERRPRTIPMEAAKAPSGVDLDTSVPAVPIGTGRLEEATTASFDPAASPAFAVRGFVEAETPDKVPEQIGGQPVFADPKIEPFITCGGSAPVGNAAGVGTKLNVAGLKTKGLDGSNVAVAIMDTGINLAHLQTKLGTMPRFDAANSWTPPGTTTAPGQHPVDHGSMCAYDVLIAAPNATLLDFPILSASAPGGTMVGRSLSAALLGFAQVLTSWAVAFAAGGMRQYRALVVSNSWGIFHPSWDFPAGHPGRYCDNPRHPFNQIVTTLVSSDVDIVFAAGNCGAQCPDMRCQGRTTQTIMGASAHPDVLTLAGCDVNDQRVGYSSQGPSISGMYPQKPDLMAYTHFLGSEAFGAGSADSGTSAACPVAAGCLAALRTGVALSVTPPANLFAQLRATARPIPGQTGWNGDCGHGIIDPVATAASLGL